MEDKKVQVRVSSRLLDHKLFVGTFLLLTGLLAINLPLPSAFGGGLLEVNHLGLLATITVTLVFIFLWRVVKINLPYQTKLFIEALFYLISVNTIVGFSGGVYSFAVFLYFIPILFASSSLRFSYSVTISLFASLIFSFHLFNTQEHFSSALASWLITLFGIWLVTALARTVTTKLLVIHKKQEDLEIEQLKHLDKIKDEFVFIIAHELRTPITAIRGYLELIINETSYHISPALLNLLHKSFATSTKLSDLVSLLLEIARMETGKISFYFQKVNVLEAVDFVLKNVESEVREKETQILVNLSKEINVYSDRERLVEILKVLISNAIDFTPEYGKISISAKRVGDYEVVVLSDDGVGIPADQVKSVFEKFYEENVNGEVKVKVYGVGLFASKELIKRMGGEITFETKVGEGTTFYIYLPVYKG